MINFTAGLFHTNQYEAAKKLAADFHIDINGYDHNEQKKKLFVPFKPDLHGLSARLAAIRADGARKEREAWIKQAADILTEYRLLLHEWLEQYTPQAEDEDWHPRFVEACAQAEIVDYLFSLIDDPLELDYFYTKCQKEVNRISERITEYRTAVAV